MKRMPFGLCNATATFQRLIAQALTNGTKKYDVVIAKPTLEDHIERLDEVFACMKRSGLKYKPSKCEILNDSIKYVGRMVDKHGIRPNPDAVDDELLGFRKLLQGVHQGLCGQSISNATTDEAQR